MKSAFAFRSLASPVWSLLPALLLGCSSGADSSEPAMKDKTNADAGADAASSRDAGASDASNPRIPTSGASGASGAAGAIGGGVGAGGAPTTGGTNASGGSPVADPPTPESKIGSFTDPRDSIVYRTVTVNGLTWMAENLRYTPNWTHKMEELGAGYAYCDDAWATVGVFYSISSIHDACPSGWRLPTQGEFIALFASLSSDPVTLARKLRAATWQGTDDIGFSVVPSGIYISNFSDEHWISYPIAQFWTSTSPFGSSSSSHPTTWTAVIDIKRGAWLEDPDSASKTGVAVDVCSIRCVQGAAPAKDVSVSVKVPAPLSTGTPSPVPPLATPEPWTGDLPANWPTWCGTPGNCGTVTDPRDNKRYRWTKLGDSIWLAENLNFESPWGSYCYANDPENCAKYGRLYEYPVAQAVCPSGWTLPNGENLSRSLPNGVAIQASNPQFRATSGWADVTDPKGNSPGNGTDDYGLSLLPAGARVWRNGGYFEGLGYLESRWNANGNDPHVRTASSVRCLWAPTAEQLALPIASSAMPDLVPRYCGLPGNCGTFVDPRDNKIYRWTQIGSQRWFAEELNYGANSDRCYEKEPNSCAASGALYTFAEANSNCPSGWHLPSLAEWKQLVTTVTGNSTATLAASTALRTSSYWLNGAGRDSFGFSARPITGLEYNPNPSDLFPELINEATWWSTDLGTAKQSRVSVKFSDNNAAGPAFVDNRESTKLAVRCLADAL